MEAKVHMEWRPLWVRGAPSCPCQAVEAQAKWKVLPVIYGLGRMQNVMRDRSCVSAVA